MDSVADGGEGNGHMEGMDGTGSVDASGEAHEDELRPLPGRARRCLSPVAEKAVDTPVGAALVADGGETHLGAPGANARGALLVVGGGALRAGADGARAPRQVLTPTTIPALAPAPAASKRARPNLPPRPPSQKHQCRRPSPPMRSSAARARRRGAPPTPRCCWRRWRRQRHRHLHRSSCAFDGATACIECAGARAR